MTKTLEIWRKIIYLNLITLKDFIYLMAFISDREVVNNKDKLITADLVYTFVEWFFAGFA